MLRFFKICIMYLIGFIFIYQPGLSSNTGRFLFIFLLLLTILVVYCLIKYGDIFIQFIFTKQFKILIFGILIASFYFMWRALSTSNSPRIIQNLMILLQIFSLLVICFILNNSFGFNRKKLLNYFLNMGLIQSFFTILMLIFPKLHNIALNLYYGSRTENMFISNVRIYGISNDYTFFTPIFHATLGVLALCLAFEFSFKYLLYIPPLILVILLNGRTGFLLFVIGGLIALVILSIKNIASFVKEIIFILLLIILGLISIYFIYENSPSTYSWISSGFQDLVNFFNGDKTGNFATLSNMLIFPTGINFFIGMGFRLYDNVQGFPHSDIGYVNDLFMGGLIYVFILYLTIIRTLIYGIDIKKVKKDPFALINLALSIAFVVMIFIANYKGEAMRSGLALVGMFLIKNIIIYIKDGESNG